MSSPPEVPKSKKDKRKASAGMDEDGSHSVPTEEADLIFNELGEVTNKKKSKKSKKAKIEEPKDDDEDDDDADNEDVSAASAAAATTAASAAAAASSMDVTDDDPKDPDFFPGDDEKNDGDEEIIKVSESEEESSDEEEAKDDDDDFIKVNNPTKAAQSTVVIPKDTNFLNPNNTLKYFSATRRLNVHYTEVNPKAHLRISETLPDPKKQGATKAFHRVTCTKPQKWDKRGGTAFTTTRFKEAMFIGPFGVTKFSAMYPHGNRIAKPKSTFPSPTDMSKIKFKLPITNEEYTAVLAVEKKAGMVDGDQDTFMSRWVRGNFEPWMAEASWKVSTHAFPIVRSTHAKEITDAFAKLDTAYEMQVEKWAAVKKNKAPKPTPPDTSAAKMEELLKEKFLAAAFKPAIGTSEKTPFSHINFAAPVLLGMTKKEQDAGTIPDIPKGDKWLHDMFHNPPQWENPKTHEKKPGWPKAPNDLPMYSCVTAEMAQAMKDGKLPKNDSCIRLIPRQDRFVEESDDVLAPIWSFSEKYDSPMGGGWYWQLIGVIWLGEKSKMDESKPAVEGVDPTTYFRLAQPYTRTKANYTPKVFGSSSSSAAAAASVSSDGNSVSFAPVAPNDPEHADFAS